MALSEFTSASSSAAAQFIRSYSTSFYLATRLLPPGKRMMISNIYALARTADELVDGVCAEAGLTESELAAALDALEDEVERALMSGYSSNPVIHAFASTARDCGIGTSLTRPFFSSMRADLSTSSFTPGEHRNYVYGSAEVVGIMCLRVFLQGTLLPPPERVRHMEQGARALGRAFQNVNFLRDLAHDQEFLGRNYLTGSVAHARLTEEQKDRWTREICQDLDLAHDAIRLLPADCRLAVTCAHGLFSLLLRRIDKVSVTELYRKRISVSRSTKLLLVAISAVRTNYGRAN